MILMVSQTINTAFEHMILSSDSYEELFVRINLFPKLPPFTYFRNYLFYSNNKISETFDNVKEHTINIIDGIKKAEINAYRVFNKNHDLFGYFVVTPIESFSNLFNVFTIADYELAYRIENKILRRIYPFGTRTFFKQDEMFSALKNLETQLIGNYSIIILDTVFKGKDKDPSNVSYIKTERSWKKQTIQEAFEEAQERNEWFSSIKFSINKNYARNVIGKKIAECRINKDGEIYYSGFNDYLQSYLQGPLIEFVNQRLIKFYNRGIRERAYVPGLPLEIQYNFNRFEDIEEIKRFGVTIRKYPNSSIAVYHSNPYYHASLADFIDGSSFDIWILSSTRIIIKPQLKATPQAIEAG